MNRLSEKNTLVFPRIGLLIAIILTMINFYVIAHAPEHFELLPILTIVASLSLLFLVLPFYNKYKSMTLLLLSICIILKYIITPLFYCIAPIDSFSHYFPQDYKSINIGIIVMVYELVAVTLFSVLFSSIDHKKKDDVVTINQRRDAIISSSNSMVFVYVVVAFVIFISFPISKNGLSFLMLKANTGIRVSSMETSSIVVLLREVVLIGFYSSFIIIAVYCAKKHIRNKKPFYLVVSLIAALLVTSIIVSEARSSQVYCGFACITLLAAIFPDNKKRIYRILISAIVIIVLILTVYKSFYAFKYSSYSDAIASAKMGASVITYNLETYCLGPLHYSAVVDLGFWNNTFPFSRLIFGFLRSVMGTNLLVKNIGMNTNSMVFNEFVSGNKMNTGYLLPITGLGYFYFSPVIAPFFTVLVLRIASRLEYSMKTTKSSFSLFFMAYVYIRLATCIVATNINTILSMSSMILLTAGLIALVNKVFRIGKRS